MAMALAATLLAAGCASGASVTVFAAASLTESFEEITRAFQDANPDTTVDLVFAASSRLAGQIASGAPADVFASASPVHMDAMVTGGFAGDEPATFAENELVIAVESGNPLGITGLRDLGRDGLVVVLAAPEVPAGDYARTALAAAGVSVSPASLETSVKAVVAKVAMGEADAGIVYRTDVLSADGSVDVVTIPGHHNVEATYPIVVLADAAEPAAARSFVAFVLSEEGAAILERFGFAEP
jgi:molybdate transport system substrate-binding protein